MATDIAQLAVSMEANTAKFQSDIERINKKMDRFSKRSTRSLRSVGDGFNQLRTVIAAAGIGLLFREIVRSADSLTLMAGRLRLVTKDSAELAVVQQKLFDVAQKTRASFETTAELYSRVALNAKQLGASQETLMGIVTATNQAIVIGGASAAEAAGGVRQFTQAIASGELRGEELRSVMENMPRLAKALADGLDTTIGGLRKMSKEGELTAERVIKALLSQSDKIQEEFEKMPRTVGQAMQQLQNQMLMVFGSANVSPLIDSIDELRTMLTDPSTVQGIASFASGVVGAFAGMAKFASETARFTKFIAESAAAFMGGANDSTRIDQRLSEIRAELGGTNRASPFDPTSPFIPAATGDRQKALEEELKLLLARKKVLDDFGSFDATVDKDINVNINTNLNGKPDPLDKVDKTVEKQVQAAIRSLESEQETATRVFHERRQLILDNVKDEQARLVLLDKLNRQWAESMEKAGDRGQEALEGVNRSLSITADQAARNIQSFTASLVDAALAGESLGDVITAAMRRIIAELITLLAIRALGEGLSGRGGFVGDIGGFLLGTRASGGPVRGGGTYLVGEEGPELFTPKASGTIIPNDALGGSTNDVVVNIDARGADPQAAANVIRESRRIVEQVVEALGRGHIQVVSA